MVIRKKDEILGTGDGVENVQPQRVEEALKVDSAQSAQPLVDVVTADNKAEKADNEPVINGNIAEAGQMGQPGQLFALKDDGKGFLQCQQVSLMLQDAPKVSIESLFHNGMWYKGGIAFLFGDAGIGKSTFATQIGRELCQARPSEFLAYMDFENDDDEFIVRYQTEDGEAVPFPNNFLRINPRWENTSAYLKAAESNRTTFFENFLKNEVKKAVETYKDDVDYFIIDNVSMLIPDGENTQKATEFMIWLKQLKASYGNQKSFLVLAHTPKVNKHLSLDANQMAGSKAFHKFTNTLIGMKEVPQYPQYIYIAELKNRAKERETQVLVYKRQKDNLSGLHFEYVGACMENDILNFIAGLEGLPDAMSEPEDNIISNKINMELQIKSMINQGYSESKIVKSLNLSSRSPVRTMKAHMRAQTRQMPAPVVHLS